MSEIGENIRESRDLEEICCHLIPSDDQQAVLEAGVKFIE